MRRIGAAVVLTPPGEIFSAMQAGAVDAAEWVGPWNDLAFGLHRVAQYYYLPAFHEPGPGLEVSINRARFDALPADLQKIVEYAAGSVASTTDADFTFHNIQSLGPLVEEHGAELRTFSEEIVRELGRVSLEVIEEIGAESPLAGRILASYRDYLAKAVPYNERMLGTMLRQRSMVHRS